MTNVEDWPEEICEERRSSLNRRLYEVRVSSDRSRVWVVGPDGSTVGRFSKTFGMDIHRSVTQQREGQGECLNCTHEAADGSVWAEFVAEIDRHFGVRLDASWLSFDESVERPRDRTSA